MEIGRLKCSSPSRSNKANIQRTGNRVGLRVGLGVGQTSTMLQVEISQPTIPAPEFAAQQSKAESYEGSNSAGAGDGKLVQILPPLKYHSRSLQFVGFIVGALVVGGFVGPIGGGVVGGPQTLARGHILTGICGATLLQHSVNSSVPTSSYPFEQTSSPPILLM